MEKNDDEEHQWLLSNSTDTYSLFTVDTYMIPSKICFFLLDGIAGMFWAFLVLFFMSVGLDIEEAGFIAGMRLLAATLVTPLWGYVADKTGHRKIIFSILCFGAAFFTFPLPLAGSIYSIKNCTNAALAEQDMLGKHTTACPYKLFTSKLFFILLLLVCLCSMFFNPLHGILDSFVMNAIQSAPRKTNYAKQRVAGAFGFGLLNFFVGLALDHSGKFSNSNYTIVFISVVAMLVLVIPAGIKVASQFNLDDRDKSTKHLEKLADQDDEKYSSVREYSSIYFLCKIDNILFLGTVFIAGIANAVVNVYLFKYLNDELHASKTVMGLANLFAALGEILVFPVSQQLLCILRGPTNVITLSVFAYALRFILLVVVKNQWLLLPVQMLNGIGFSVFWLAAAEHTEQIAPSELYITTFTIVSNVYFNLAGMTGNWLGGVIYKLCSGEGLFLLTSALCSVFIVIRVFYYNLIKIFCLK